MTMTKQKRARLNAYSRAYSRKRRSKATAEGVCVSCLCTPATDGAKTCAGCREKSAKWQRKNREEYPDRQLQAERKRRADRAARGVCTRCGKHPKSAPHLATCDVCRAQGKAADDKRKLERASYSKLKRVRLAVIQAWTSTN